MSMKNYVRISQGFLLIKGGNYIYYNTSDFDGLL